MYFQTIGLWNQDVHTTQWQITTQPNFITKVKPMHWEKLPTSLKPKPSKKPIASTMSHMKRPTLSTPTTITNSLPQSNKPRPAEVN